MDVKTMLLQWANGFLQLGHPPVEALFVLKHGRLFNGAPLPKKVERGRIKMCFENATRLSIKGHHSYVEGFGTRADIGIPIHHAWCCQLTNHKVVDPTWDRPEECSYFGVAFEYEFVRFAMHRTRHWGILGHQQDNRAVMLDFDPKFDDYVAQCIELKRVV